MKPLELITTLLSEEGREDPYPLYAELREHGTLVTVEPGYLVATSFDAVNGLLRDPTFAAQDASFLLLSSSILSTNPPEHTRVRRLMSGAFTARRVAELAVAIESQANALIDEITQKGAPADLIDDFAYRLPLGVICELLGVPEKDRSWFRPVAADFAIALEGTFTLDEAAAAQSAAELFEAYFSDLVRSRRGTRQNDLISELVSAAELSESELLGNLALLLLAGFETTTNLIGNGVMTLLQRPEQLARLSGAPELVDVYVEEFLRFDPPVQLTSREAKETTVLEGQRIEAGTYLMALIGSANRDPDRFVHPDHFHPERPGNTSISFGAGAHFCLGAALARLEARIAFPLLLRRLPQLALAGEPLRRNRLVLRGYESLPITWT
ncbi:cytochrome P450 [Rhizocola hellebori]|uniref:Cytochrome P450 n=1 Tax=Rhizocola hellebori TaxID=1392758 RepID=A0A8J3VEG7_9ACTN|nr:cytochrome P450 [Rhizocola hellebori]GIH03327.1 cytochrome P450 [Rhizocola hellebori]